MTEYVQYAFFGWCLALAFLTRNRPEGACWAILSAMSIASIAIDFALYSRIDHPAEMLLYGLEDTATIYLIWRFAARSPVALWQAGSLTCLWLLRLTVYADLVADTDMAYSHYEPLMLSLLAAQAMAGGNAICEFGSMDSSRRRLGGMDPAGRLDCDWAGEHS